MKAKTNERSNLKPPTTNSTPPIAILGGGITLKVEDTRPEDAYFLNAYYAIVLD